MRWSERPLVLRIHLHPGWSKSSFFGESNHYEKPIQNHAKRAQDISRWETGLKRWRRSGSRLEIRNWSVSMYSDSKITKAFTQRAYKAKNKCVTNKYMLHSRISVQKNRRTGLVSVWPRVYTPQRRLRKVRWSAGGWVRKWNSFWDHFSDISLLPFYAMDLTKARRTLLLVRLQPTRFKIKPPHPRKGCANDLIIGRLGIPNHPSLDDLQIQRRDARGFFAP